MWILSLLLMLALYAASLYSAYRLGAISFHSKQLKSLKALMETEKSELETIKEEGRDEDGQVLHDHLMRIVDGLFNVILDRPVDEPIGDRPSRAPKVQVNKT